MALGERAITSVGSLTPAQGQNTVVNLCLRVLDEVNKDVEARGWWFQSPRGDIIGIAPGTPAWNASHPEEFRRYVTIRSARILQTRYITDETLHKLTLEEEIYSKAVLEAKDAQQDSSVTFDLPQAIENLGIREVMFLQSNMEEKLATLKLGTELQQTSLVEKQVDKTLSEQLLVDAQELLVDQQKLTEVQETAKRTAEVSLLADQENLVEQQVLTEVNNTAKVLREGELLSAQITSVGAEVELKQQQSKLTASQELKTDAEKLLVDAQELKTDAEKLLIDEQAAKTTAEASLIADQEALITQQLQTEINETSKRLSEKGLVDAQVVGVSADIDLKQQQSNLTASQELKTDAETALIADQEALVTQQALTEAQETTKREAEKDLVIAQDAKTDAEKEILESQKTKLDAETAYMITAEKNWFDTGGVAISGTVRSYKDFRPEMRIMGIQEAAFQSLPAYKKVELIKDAVQLRSDRSVTTTLPSIVGSVNKVLRMLGVTPVNFNTNEHALASEAKELLEDTDLELQARGWWFNTEKDVTFTITAGKIVVDTTTQLYEELDDYDTTRVLDGLAIILKNLKDNTIDEFSGTIKGTRIVKRSINHNEVPPKYRQYLEVKVAAILAELYPQSGSEIQRIRKQEAELETYFKDRENDQGNYNIFDNYDTAERIGFNRNYDLN